jgi:flagellar motor protein MotB
VRRLLEDNGVKGSQFRMVAGFADTKPLGSIDTTDERNRRVTLLLRVNKSLD